VCGVFTVCVIVTQGDVAISPPTGLLHPHRTLRIRAAGQRAAHQLLAHRRVGTACGDATVAVERASVLPRHGSVVLHVNAVVARRASSGHVQSDPPQRHSGAFMPWLRRYMDQGAGTRRIRCRCGLCLWHKYLLSELNIVSSLGLSESELKAA